MKQMPTNPTALIYFKQLELSVAQAVGKRACGFAALAIFCAAAPLAPAASTDTWVGGGNNFSTTANWSYSSGSGPVATGDSLVFAAAGSTTPNNDESSFTYGGITFNAGGLAFTIGGNAFTLGGNITDNQITGTETINNNMTLSASRTATVATSASLTLGGIIDDGGHAYGFTKASAGTLTLSGANTFTGTFTGNGGTVVIAALNNLGAGSAYTFGGSSTTTIKLTQPSGTVTIPSSSTITVNSSSFVKFLENTASTTFEIAAKITGAGGVGQSSSSLSGSTVKFDNDTSDYTGSFSMGYGKVQYTSVANGGSPSSLGAASSAYSIGNSSSAGTFQYVGSGNTTTTRDINWTATTGGLALDSSGSGSVGFLDTATALRTASGSAMLTLQGTSTGNNTLAQPVNNGVSSGTTSVTKSGAGMWILTGANTYSGATAVNVGTLLVNGDSSGSSSAFTVASSAMLGGTGKIGGSVTLQTGALATNVLGSPLTISGALVLNNNTLNVFVPGGTPLAAGNYTLMTYNTAGSSGSFNSAPSISGVGLAANTAASVVTSGGTVTLQVVQTILPTTLALSSSALTNGYLAPLTLTASVQTNSVTAVTATGNVTFTYQTNGVPFLTNTVTLASGSAVTNLSFNLPRGTNLITAIYSGDGNYLGSTNSIDQVITNHPPVTANLAVTRNAGVYSLRIPVSDLLTNVTDADGDSLSLVSTGASTNGVTVTQVTVSGTNYLYYYNTNNVADQFSYTVTDGFGGTNSANVNLAVNSAVTGQLTGQITSFTGGVASLVFHGIPNYIYITERSTNLTDWVGVQTNNAGTNGVIDATDTFNDLGGVPPASAYYRLKYQP